MFVRRKLPNVPTFGESGLADVNMLPIFRLIGPAGLPKDVVDTIAPLLQQSITSGDLHKRLLSLCFEPVGNNPEAFAQRIDTEVSKLANMIRRANIQPN